MNYVGTDAVARIVFQPLQEVAWGVEEVPPVGNLSQESCPQTGLDPIELNPVTYSPVPSGSGQTHSLQSIDRSTGAHAYRVDRLQYPNR